MKRSSLKSVTTFLGLLLGLCSPCVLAAETTLAIGQTRFGETIIYESDSPARTIDGSLENLAYGMGWQQFRLDPLTLLLGSLFTSEHNAALNRPAIESFLATTDTRYLPITAGFQLRTHRLDNDGTIETPNLGPVKIESIENFLRWFGVDAWATENLASMVPANKRIISRWLEGSQAAARELEDDFYAQHPALRETNIVAYYYNLRLEDIVRAYAWLSQSYDYGGLLALLGVAADWLLFQSLGTPLPGGMSTVDSPATGPLLPNFKAPHELGIGASNGAAFTFIPTERPDRRECVVAGEPHQPSSYDLPGGPLQQMKLFQAYVRGKDRQLVPLFVAAYPTLPAFAGLQFTPWSATSGTADPIGAGLFFFVETNGVEYLYEGVWRPFKTSPLTITREGQSTTINRFEVPEFGVVFALVRQPDTGRYFALTWRQKSPSNMLDGFWSRLRAGLRGDGAAYVAALERALPFYGEAGCHPARPSDPATSKRLAYYAMNQGKIDKVSEPELLDPTTVNPARPGSRKIGLDPSTVCVGQTWTTSDNGNFKSGCPANPQRPNYQDPGLETFRQAAVRRWATEKLANPISRSEVLNFATSTDSIVVARFIEILVAAIDGFAATQIPTELRPLVAAIGDILRVNTTGAIYDTPEQILVTYLFLELVDPIIRRSVPMPSAVREYLIRTEVTRAEMLAALDTNAAAVLLDALIAGTTFVMNECLAKGITTYSEALSMTVSGSQVANGFAGPGLDARSTAQLRFSLDSFGQKTCALNLIGSSPLKFVATEDEVYYLPFGPNVSPLGFESDLYTTANAAWGEHWARHNRAGNGNGGIESYRRFSLAIRSTPPDISTNATRSFTVTIPRSKKLRTLANRMKGSLKRISSGVGQLKSRWAIRTASTRRTQERIRERLKNERRTLLRLVTSYTTNAVPTDATAALGIGARRLSSQVQQLLSTVEPDASSKRAVRISISELNALLATRR